MIVDIRLLQGKIIQDPDQHGLIAVKISLEERLEQLLHSLVQEDEELKEEQRKYAISGPGGRA